MKNIMVAVQDIAPEGQSFTVDDSAVWAVPLAEFLLPCIIAEPIVAEVFVLPQADGCLVRGTIRGKVVMPCNRCAEETTIVIDQTFDDFEEYPADDKLEAENDTDLLSASNVISLENGKPTLDISALLWEEFSLALPVKPLCGGGCKGVCPVCGKNLNEGPCACRTDEGDPRLAALRNLKVQR